MGEIYNSHYRPPSIHWLFPYHWPYNTLLSKTQFLLLFRHWIYIMHVQWGFLLVLSSNLSEKHVHWVKWWSSTFVVLTSKPQIKSHMFSHYHYMKCCVVCTSITSSNLHELIKCLDYCTDILNYPFVNEIQALSKCNKKQRTI